MKSSALVLLAFRLALPGYHYEFPRDHYNHPEFQTEWWYYTGNLHTADGRRFGFELTFFRQGVSRSQQRSVWDVQDVWMAHLALSDIDGKQFLHAERFNRAGAGLAGADEKQARVWNGNWSATPQHLQAVADRFQFSLQIHPEKPPVIHGENGVSQKSAGMGHASHYISFTRIGATGAIRLDNKDYHVDGLTWMDHEFFTRQLEANQTGWDWFSLQLEDGSDLMLFRLRRKDGAADPYSAGTYVDKQGRGRHLSGHEFEVTPGRMWHKYPVEWTINVPSLHLNAAVTTPLDDQEVTSSRVAAYWEGAITVTGSQRGVGYLEMTGYASPLQRELL
jgi:predicted secreted hydrolase